MDPTNEAIARLQKLAEENKITTGLTTIGDEKEWNVFLRMGTDPAKYVHSSHTSSVSLLTSDIQNGQAERAEEQLQGVSMHVLNPS